MTNILVVDNHAVVRRSIRSLLADETGWDLREAENGKVAVDLTQKQRPDIVVLDLVMPVMNSMEAAYEIKKIAPKAKIVFISSHYSPDQTSALNSGTGISQCKQPPTAKAGKSPATGVCLAAGLSRLFLGCFQRVSILW
jgi:CheY-like chemotaxis protein